MRPVWLLQLATVFSIFEAAAALVLGGFGLQPALVPASLFVAYVVLQILLGVNYVGSSRVWWAVIPFGCMTVWAVAGSWLLPQLFAGEVYVWPQKLEPPVVSVLLQPTTANLNQVLYLIVNSVVLIMSALFFSGTRSYAVRVMQAYFLSGFLAVGIGFWQFAYKLAGVPFPDSFLFSNPGWAILEGQTVGLVPRISGSFSEPAAFAGYVAGILCCTGWLILRGHRGLTIRALFGFALLAMICSTSTTAYGVLALMLATLPIYSAVTGSWSLMIRIILGVILLATALGCIYLFVSAYLPETMNAIDQIVADTMDKSGSSSYQERTAADLDSLSLVLPTYGLGVGWGSNRSSSLIPGLLANIGFWGVLVIIWFGWRVAAMVSQARRVLLEPADARVLDGATGAIVGYLAAGVLSGPVITSVAFYVFIGVLIGTSARIVSGPSAPRLVRVPAQPRTIPFPS